MPDLSMGFDGKNFWLADEKESYKGDPIFYHNLMFYFYSMPFVLSDKGLRYYDTEDLIFEEKRTPVFELVLTMVWAFPQKMNIFCTTTRKL